VIKIIIFFLIQLLFFVSICFAKSGWEIEWEKFHGIKIYDKSAKATKFKSLLEKGDAYQKSDNYYDAISFYTKAIELKPNSNIGYFKRGVSYFSLKNYQYAIFDFNKAIKLNAKDPLQYSYRGMSYTNLKNYLMAINDFNKAIKLNPKIANEHFYAARALCYSALGQGHLRATSDIIKVRELPLISNDSWYKLACSFSLMNMESEACESLKTSVEQGFNDWNHIKYNSELNNIRNASCYNQIMQKAQAEAGNVNSEPPSSQTQPPFDPLMSSLSVGYLKTPRFLRVHSVSRMVETNEALFYDPETGIINYPYQGEKVDPQDFVEGKDAKIQGTTEEIEDNINIKLAFITDFSFSRVLLNRAELPLADLKFKQNILKPYPRKEYELQFLVPKKTNKNMRLDIITQQGRHISFSIAVDKERITITPLSRTQAYKELY